MSHVKDKIEAKKILGVGKAGKYSLRWFVFNSVSIREFLQCKEER